MKTQEQIGLVMFPMAYPDGNVEVVGAVVHEWDNAYDVVPSFWYGYPDDVKPTMLVKKDGASFLPWGASSPLLPWGASSPLN